MKPLCDRKSQEMKISISVWYSWTTTQSRNHFCDSNLLSEKNFRNWSNFITDGISWISYVSEQIIEDSRQRSGRHLDFDNLKIWRVLKKKKKN